MQGWVCGTSGPEFVDGFAKDAARDKGAGGRDGGEADDAVGGLEELEERFLS